MRRRHTINRSAIERCFHPQRGFTAVATHHWVRDFLLQILVSTLKEDLRPLRLKSNNKKTNGVSVSTLKEDLRPLRRQVFAITATAGFCFHPQRGFTAVATLSERGEIVRGHQFPPSKRIYGRCDGSYPQWESTFHFGEFSLDLWASHAIIHTFRH